MGPDDWNLLLQLCKFRIQVDFCLMIFPFGNFAGSGFRLVYK